MRIPDVFEKLLNREKAKILQKLKLWKGSIPRIPSLFTKMAKYIRTKTHN